VHLFVRIAFFLCTRYNIVSNGIVSSNCRCWCYLSSPSHWRGLHWDERIVNKKPMMDLIGHYFSVGYEYKEILASLLLIHGIKVSLLKEIIKRLNFHRFE
jgi:hypothetical protein